MRCKQIGSLLSVLLCVSLGSADLMLPRKRDAEQNIPGQAIRSFTDTFKANEPARVIATGKADGTCLALYVFDAQGNCVGRDDKTDPPTCNDLLVEWIPPEQARYSAEVRNAGFLFHVFQIALR